MLQTRTGDFPIDDMAVEEKKRISMSLYIRCQTWLIDTCGLFDYTSNDLKLAEHQCDFTYDTYYLCRIDCDVSLIPALDVSELSKLNKNIHLLLFIERHSGKKKSGNPFFLDNIFVHPVLDEKNKYNRAWFVLRYLKNCSISLNIGNYIRFGRYTFIIKDVVNSKTSLPSKVDYFEIEPTKNDEVSLNDSSTIDSYVVSSELLMCRICLGTLNNNTKNFLTAPCHCKGTMQWVHLSCLKAWLNGKTALERNSNIVYWQPAKCELCAMTYHPTVRVPCVSYSEEDNVSLKARYKQVELLESLKLVPPYLILSKFYIGINFLSSEPENQSGYYSICLKKNATARLGRGNKSDLKLTDISVSRLHATVKYKSVKSLGCFNSFKSSKSSKESGFILKDNRSKFGTLLEIRHPVQLKKNFPFIAIQVGRTLITITLK